MRQLVLAFGGRPDPAQAIPLAPEVQTQLVQWMATAVLAVVGETDEQGGNDDPGAIQQQDQATAPSPQGGGLHAPVQRPAGA